MTPRSLNLRNYKEALENLHGRESLCLKNQTKLVKNCDDTIGVRLYSTDVIRFYPDGSITLSSGGWHTPTTKDRINSYGSHGNVWSSSLIKDWVYAWRGMEYEFRDGMRLRPDGKPNTRPAYFIVLEDRLGAKIPDTAAAEEVIGSLELKRVKSLMRNRQLKSIVARYCKREYLPLFINDEDISDVLRERMVEVGNKE